MGTGEHALWRRVGPAAAGLGLALSLAIVASGCGGSSSAASAGGGSSTSADRNDAQVKLARCLREHGVDVEDPAPGRGGAIGIRGKRGDEQKLEQAQKACQKLVPGGFKEPTPEEQEKFKDAALAFARCMRAHGVDMPDPKFDRGRVSVSVRRQGPKFDEAQKACQKLMPQPKEAGS